MFSLDNNNYKNIDFRIDNTNRFDFLYEIYLHDSIEIDIIFLNDLHYSDRCMKLISIFQQLSIIKWHFKI